jgi:hypothetical protein
MYTFVADVDDAGRCKWNKRLLITAPKLSLLADAPGYLEVA